MKNNTKSIVLLITLMLMVCLLMGCSNAATQPEEVEEPEVVEDPGEVTYITDFANLHAYVETLDAYEPDILVYNEEEGYIINMQEGQHYQLKANDQIAIYNPEKSIKMGWKIELGNSMLFIGNYGIFEPDYSNWEQNQEFFFSKRNENDEKVKRTCYFDPPTE